MSVYREPGKPATELKLADEMRRITKLVADEDDKREEARRHARAAAQIEAARIKIRCAAEAGCYYTQLEYSTEKEARQWLQKQGFVIRERNTESLYGSPYLEVRWGK